MAQKRIGGLSCLNGFKDMFEFKFESCSLWGESFGLSYASRHTNKQTHEAFIVHEKIL